MVGGEGDFEVTTIDFNGVGVNPGNDSGGRVRLYNLPISKSLRFTMKINPLSVRGNLGKETETIHKYMYLGPFFAAFLSDCFHKGTMIQRHSMQIGEALDCFQ